MTAEITAALAYEAPARICGTCGWKITSTGGEDGQFGPGSWYTPDGNFWHEDGSLHEPGVPDSRVVDEIVTWTNSDGSLNVQPGDLILWANDFRLVRTIEPHASEDGVMVLLDGGMPWPTYCRGAGLVAVRRYVTGGLTDA